MPQFDVFRNRDPGSRAAFPFLLDVQSDLLADLATRVVIPLCPASAMKGKLLGKLTPTLLVEGKSVVALTTQLAGIAVKQLGPRCVNLESRRAELVAALDFLITGI